MKTLRPYQRQAVQDCWEALKKDTRPVLLMASVGAGKSLMLADILLTLQKNNKRALCLVNNAELVRNNCQTFIEYGGLASIYCAAIGEKDISQPIVFGTPQSVLNGITKEEPIAFIHFNMIIVDEAHNINFVNPRTSFMRILRHYKQEYKEMRLLGATGTNFRFKGNAIVGERCLFKTQVGNITTEQLIKDGYLIEPTFHVDPNLVLDFSHVKIKKTGQFDAHDLEKVVDKSTRLTKLICKQVVHIMQEQNRFGVFFFATTKKHAEEIYSHLPPNESAIILGETPQHERTQILNKARTGIIKYLVNIAIISVGVDIPAYDTIAYLRPTESLVLLVQTMGRVLRLSETTNKKESLVLDFAGNIERHRDWDNPLLQKAVSTTIDKDYPLVILCPECKQYNTEHARRCVTFTNDKRCSYYFEYKECPNQLCKVKNDISSRHCRVCHEEIIDPNSKLRINHFFAIKKEVDVFKSSYVVTGTQRSFRVNCVYYYRDKQGNQGTAFESYSPVTERARNVFYGQFVRKHSPNSSKWYPYLHDKIKVQRMLQEINHPTRLTISVEEDAVIIKKKHFN